MLNFIPFFSIEILAFVYSVYRYLLYNEIVNSLVIAT